MYPLKGKNWEILKQQKAFHSHLLMAGTVLQSVHPHAQKTYSSINDDPPVRDVLGRRTPSSSSSCFPTKFYLLCLMTHQNVFSRFEYLRYDGNAIQKKWKLKRLTKIIPMCKFL